MNGPDRSKMEQMQKEAARRAREMQQRAIPAPEGIPPMPNFVKTPYQNPGQSAPPRLHPQPQKSSPPPPPPVSNPPKNQGLNLLRMLNFGQMQMQGDTLLVVMLLLLLAGDGADELLLLALVYILL